MAPHLSTGPREDLVLATIPDQHLNVVLTCTDCGVSYEPTPEDFDTGRLGCLDPDCGGWTMIAETITVIPTQRDATDGTR